MVVPLPDRFVARMRELLGDEAEDLIAALDEPRSPALRLNTLRGDATALGERLPWHGSPISWCAEGRLVAAQSAEVAGHPLNDAGVYYQQDPAAMAVAKALAPRPGEVIVDLAAAPGGKTTHTAALAADGALVIANDVDERRARSLLGNVERLGVTRAAVTSTRPERLVAALAGACDAVLLDAPCSGEGMFRRSQAARETWSEAGVERNAGLQKRLIDSAANLVRPGGRLVYSTCTLDPREDEEVVAWLLERRPDFQLDPLALLGVDDTGRFGLPGTARLWPHRSVGDGHFVARLSRDPDAEPIVVRSSQAGAAARRGSSNARGPRRSAGSPRADAEPGWRAAWRAFAAEHLTGDAAEPPRLERYGRRLLGVPESFEPLPGVHVLRAGLHVGDVTETGGGVRFVPAHALAMGAAGDWGAGRIEIGDDPEALASYREGGTVPAPGLAGYCLVTYRGFPLGLALAKSGEARSMLPKGLRRAA